MALSTSLISEMITFQEICHILIFSDDIYDDILDLKIIKYKMNFTVLAVLTVLNHFLNVYILEETGAIIRGCSGVISGVCVISFCE